MQRVEITEAIWAICISCYIKYPYGFPSKKLTVCYGSHGSLTVSLTVNLCKKKNTNYWLGLGSTFMYMLRLVATD